MGFHVSYRNGSGIYIRGDLPVSCRQLELGVELGATGDRLADPCLWWTIGGVEGGVGWAEGSRGANASIFLQIGHTQLVDTVCVSVLLCNNMSSAQWVHSIWWHFKVNIVFGSICSMHIGHVIEPSSARTAFAYSIILSELYAIFGR